MKAGILRAALILAALALFTAAGFYGYRWWASRQRMQALSEYLRSGSPVVRRLPSDATVYINLHNLRRVHSGIQNTRLYHVITHWLDTGMGDDKGSPNALMGGMLEKTLLNVLGEEIGIAFSPSGDREPDVVVVARLAAGSDFLLRLALSQNKKLGRISAGDETIYVMKTGNAWYPQFFFCVDSEFVYLSNSQERLGKGSIPEGTGPEFLAAGVPDSIPETTFLYFRSSNPGLYGIGYNEGNLFHLQMRANSLVTGALPAPGSSETAVLDLITNVPRLLRQPAVALSVHSVHGAPVSTAILAFNDENRADRYAERLRRQFTSGLPPEGLEETESEESSCLQFPHRNKLRTLCRRGELVLIAGGDVDTEGILRTSGVEAPQKRPLTLTLRIRQDALAEFRALLDREDWSRFQPARAFYFISCIRRITGGIGAGQNEIVAEIE